MEDRRVRRRVERDPNVSPRDRRADDRRTSDGTANVPDTIEEVGGERAEDVERHETIVERRGR